MNKLTRIDPLDDLFRGFFVRPVDMNGPVNTPSIRMDVTEQAKVFLVHAELPGVKKEDIHVHIEGNQVSISAEIRQENTIKEGDRILRAERTFGQVSRTFQLSQDIDDTQSTARFSDGVLELTLPKKAASASKRLTIE